jgi:hypothetical protein
VSARLPRRRIFVAIVGVYGLGLLAWWLSPAFRESMVGKFVAIPLFSVYILEHMGVPGLTDRSRCDWMWCTPTTLGIVVVAVVWVGVAWALSLGIARITRRV